MKKRFKKAQMMAFKHARSVDHPALFLDMRLGKTLTTIRRILLYRPQNPSIGLRVLIVGPEEALSSWAEELNSEGERDVVFVQGTRAKRLKLLEENHRWNLINKEGYIAVPELSDYDWDSVVLDESIFIMNPKSNVTKYFTAHRFSHVPHRWILTGKPYPKDYLQVYSQFRFLYPNPFNCKNYYVFRNRYFKQFGGSYEWVPKIGAETYIKNYISEHAITISRKEMGLDTEKVYKKRMIEMPSKFRKVYREMEDEMILEWKNKEVGRTKFKPVQALWMRQLCGGFIQEELVWPGKIKALEQLFKGELANEPSVVYFAFNQELEACYELLSKRGVSCQLIRGSVPKSERRRIASDFRKGKFQVLLLQERVGRTGLNLSAADTVLYYSIVGGSHARMQTEDRVITMDKTQPVLYIDLLVADTVEETMFEKQQQEATTHKWSLNRIFKLILEKRGEV